MSAIQRFLSWLRRLFSGGRETPPVIVNPLSTLPAPKTVVTLLVFPNVSDGLTFNQVAEVDGERYYISSPWDVPVEPVNQAVRFAEAWLSDVLGERLPWDEARVIHSQRSLAEWRSGKIGLIRGEVELLGLPWTDDYVYVALVRGMGGYAGGINYQRGVAGYAMVGDVCLEAITGRPEPTAGSVLLGHNPDGHWPENSYGLVGQRGALIHEALHGLDLPHPDLWPDGDQPGWDETLMGHWWNMPNYANTGGLTRREVERVLGWLRP